jgi:hypothetical protein
LPSIDHIGKRGIAPLYRVLEHRVGFHRDIEIFNFNDQIRTGAPDARYLATDDLDHDSLLNSNARYLIPGNTTIAGLHHLMYGLQANSPIIGSPRGRAVLGHLQVYDAAARGHPLNVPWLNNALIPDAITMLDPPFEHVRYRLDAPVGMPGKARQIILRIVRMEIVQKQKKGFKTGASAWPNARLSRTPAPSRVGLLFRIRAILRMAVIGTTN